MFVCGMRMMYCLFFFFQAEDGIRDLVRSRGLGDVYKRQVLGGNPSILHSPRSGTRVIKCRTLGRMSKRISITCLLYTSDAADERSSVDLGGRRIIKKKNNDMSRGVSHQHTRNKNSNNKRSNR